MALDNRLVVYNEQGEPVDYDILASDVKILPDGKDLPTKLAELEDEIGQGGYAPPEGGIPKTDLAQSVQDSLDKADSALQDEDLADYATKTELQQGLATRQDKLQAGNGIVIGNDGKTVSVDAEVVQPVSADGTFAVRIGNNTYTINLNHEHPQYQPLLSSANAGSNITITTDQQGNIIISATGGGGGGTQVQADWNQTDSTAVDFIKNKPTAVSAFTNDAGYLTQQSLAGRVQSQDVVSIVKISQSDYDNLSVKDSSTLYLITES